MTDVNKLLTQFDKYAYGKSAETAFTNLLDAILIPFKMYDTPQEHEAMIATITGLPQRETLASMAKLIGELSEGFRDPFGELYMQKVSKGHMGQYFTPEHVCDLMAAISVGIPESGKTVLDPACGSGRMLLSAAKINRDLEFYGADIDAVCCKMALVNMLLQSLIGEIAHMNSLSNEFFTGYRVRTTLFNGHYYPWYWESTNPDDSSIWLRSTAKPDVKFADTTILHPAGGYNQGTLF